VTDDVKNQYLYDAEGRICAVASTLVASMTTYTGYLYDADGTRVAKGTISKWSCDPSTNGFTTINDFVLGLGGEQVTEMGIDTTAGSNVTTLAWQHTNVWAGGKLLGTYDKTGLHFYLDDPLGTRRAQTNYAGVLEQTCSSLPYGDALSCTGGDLAAPTEHHFTGKERDTESGNDYFEARYFSSAMGRFMSPDWSAKEEPVPYAKLDDPQTLNLYTYVENNPMDRTDADGHDSHGQIADWIWNHAQAAYNKYFGSTSPSQQNSMNIPKDKRIIVVPNVQKLAGHDTFGNHDGTCYDLGVAYGMPASSKQISPGPVPDGNTPVGTLVGTFSGAGGTKYSPHKGQGHIAALLGFGDRKGINSQDPKGMWVMDQYAGRGEVNKSFIPFGGKKNYNNDANNYRIVLSPQPAKKEEK
jgi:RHS repeat-associated protein